MQTENVIELSEKQKDLLSGVCTFYGLNNYLMFVLTREKLIKVLDAIIGELEFKVINSQVRYHSILATDIDALRSLYAQIV